MRWIATDVKATRVPDVPLSLTKVEHSPRPEDLAYVQFTAGTTQSPRCVKVSHKSLWEMFRAMAECFRVDVSHPPSIGLPCSNAADVVTLSWLPLYHDMGLVHNALNPIYRGGSAILFSPLSFLQMPLSWPLAMSQFRATISAGPVFAFRQVAQKWLALPVDRRPSLDLSRMKSLTIGAELVRLESLELWSKVFGPYGFQPQALNPGYGLAEATVAVSGERNPAPITSLTRPDLVSCGSRFAVGRSQVLVITLDSDKKSGITIAGEGQLGEIIFTGDTLTMGYLDEVSIPSQTARTHYDESSEHWIAMDMLPPEVQIAVRKVSPNLFADVWFRTGDIGMLEDSHLFVVGRTKEMVKLENGDIVSAADVEHVVTERNQIIRPGSVAIVQLSSAETGAPGATILLCEVRGELKAGTARVVLDSIRALILQKYGLLVKVILLKKRSLPRTTSGKLRRTLAGEMWRQGKLTSKVLAKN